VFDLLLTACPKALCGAVLLSSAKLLDILKIFMAKVKILKWKKKFKKKKIFKKMPHW